MEIEDKVLIERERIKTIIKEKQESIIKRFEKKTRKYRTINKSQVLEILENIIFWIDNPDYVRVKDRKSLSIS